MNRIGLYVRKRKQNLRLLKKKIDEVLVDSGNLFEKENPIVLDHPDQWLGMGWSWVVEWHPSLAKRKGFIGFVWLEWSNSIESYRWMVEMWLMMSGQVHRMLGLWKNFDGYFPTWSNQIDNVNPNGQLRSCREKSVCLGNVWRSVVSMINII